MLRLIEKEIPKRLQSNVVFLNYITLSRSERFILLLTNDFNLFEIRSHEIRNLISLKDTILKGLSLPVVILPPPSLPSGAGASTSIQCQHERQQYTTNTTDGNGISKQQVAQNSHNSFTFGKYFQNLENQQNVFILLKVYTKLLVLERKTNGYEIKYQYENVEKFEIVDSKNNYRSVVGIHLIEEPFYIVTNFIESDRNKQNNINNNSLSMIINDFKNPEYIKNLLEKIKKAKVELEIHKIRTKNEFFELKNRLRFGLDLIRSESLGEKQMLGKYGDVWMKVANEQLIIGIPIINNCSERLKCIYDIRLAIICEDKNDINFEYNLYQLKNDLYKFKITDELLCNNDDENFINENIKFNDEWLPIQTRTLHPETSGVIVLTTKLENLILPSSTSTIDIHNNHEYLCFILYDVVYKRKKFTQQHFLKKIQIETDLLFNKDYQVEMDLKRNEYMDLLAITATSCFANLLIILNDNDDDKNHNVSFDEFFTDFKNFITQKLEFKYLMKNFKKRSDYMKNDTDDDFAAAMMNVDEEYEQEHKLNLFNEDNSNEDSYELFYNDCKTMNYWYGSLIRLKLQDENTINFKIYTRSDDKIYTFVKAIYNDLSYKFKVIPMNYTEMNLTKNLKHFENCLRNELKMLKGFFNKNNNDMKNLECNELIEFQKELCAKELETDLAAVNYEIF